MNWMVEKIWTSTACKKLELNTLYRKREFLRLKQVSPILSDLLQGSGTFSLCEKDTGTPRYTLDLEKSVFFDCDFTFFSKSFGFVNCESNTKVLTMSGITSRSDKWKVVVKSNPKKRGFFPAIKYQAIVKVGAQKENLDFISLQEEV